MHAPDLIENLGGRRRDQDPLNAVGTSVPQGARLKSQAPQFDQTYGFELNHGLLHSRMQLAHHRSDRFLNPLDFHFEPNCDKPPKEPSPHAAQKPLDKRRQDDNCCLGSMQGDNVFCFYGTIATMHTYPVQITEKLREATDQGWHKHI